MAMTAAAAMPPRSPAATGTERPPIVVLGLAIGLATTSVVAVEEARTPLESVTTTEMPYVPTSLGRQLTNAPEPEQPAGRPDHENASEPEPPETTVRIATGSPWTTEASERMGATTVGSEKTTIRIPSERTETPPSGSLAWTVTVKFPATSGTHVGAEVLVWAHPLGSPSHSYASIPDPPEDEVLTFTA
jgi:hypothetical protein